MTADRWAEHAGLIEDVFEYAEERSGAKTGARAALAALLDELARLRAERDAAERESALQMGDKLEAQTALMALWHGLALDDEAFRSCNGWTEGAVVMAKRIEEIVDHEAAAVAELARVRVHGETPATADLIAQRDAAETRAAELERQLLGGGTAAREGVKGVYGLTPNGLAEFVTAALEALGPSTQSRVYEDAVKALDNLRMDLILALNHRDWEKHRADTAEARVEQLTERAERAEEALWTAHKFFSEEFISPNDWHYSEKLNAARHAVADALGVPVVARAGLAGDSTPGETEQVGGDR